MHNKSVIVAQETERRSKALHVIKTNLVAYNENLEDHLWQYYTEICLTLHYFSFAHCLGLVPDILGILPCSNNQCLLNAQHSRFTQCVVKDLHISSSVRDTALHKKTLAGHELHASNVNKLNRPPRKSCLAHF